MQLMALLQVQVAMIDQVSTRFSVSHDNPQLDDDQDSHSHHDTNHREDRCRHYDDQTDDHHLVVAVQSMMTLERPVW